MKEECIICKAPLIYLEKDEMMEPCVEAALGTAMRLQRDMPQRTHPREAPSAKEAHPKAMRGWHPEGGGESPCVPSAGVTGQAQEQQT